MAGPKRHLVGTRAIRTPRLRWAAVDRDRLIDEVGSKGLDTGEGRLDVLEVLGRGGNGVALLCSGQTMGEVVAKLYIPPDTRDLDEQSLGRFRNEIKLASKIRHPHVIPALGSGAAHVGAYVLPYYLMPQAASTLRVVMGQPRDPDGVRRVARLFLEACLGVSCLHSHGIVHRDLKPENLLISREGSVWVADLGIAHIDSDFVSVSLRTVAAEQLLNRDYYAPEQRFGTHAEVDARADIYALGCILYELFVGAPPVRRDSPTVASVNRAFAALDPVINRMTSYEPDARYQHIESALVDICLALGWIAATVRGAREPAPREIKEMVRLLRSSNGVNRSSGVQLAVALGSEALADLHDLLGHGRREVRNAVAVALGAIGDERSLPFLVAGMLGNSRTASTFRPTVDVAAASLSRYPVETRKGILDSLDQQIRPDQVLLLLSDFPSDAAFAAVRRLEERGLLLLDFTESTLEMLIAIDEPSAWPAVRAQARQVGGWTLARILPQLSDGNQLALARTWMAFPGTDPWHWDRMVKTIAEMEAERAVLKPLIEELTELLNRYPGRAAKRAELANVLSQRAKQLEGT